MKPVEFTGKTLEIIREFPDTARREAGHQLDRLQRGLEPLDWKPMPSVGIGVREIRIQQEGQFRVIYIAKFSEAIYVLHAFTKKTQKTSQRDLEMANKALKELFVTKRDL